MNLWDATRSRLIGLSPVVVYLSQIIILAFPPLIFLILFYCSDRGFDVTDESYYLLKTFFPREDVTNLTSFGRYLSLINFSGSIFILRVIGISVLALCTIILSLSYSSFLDRWFPQKNYRISFPVLTSFLLTCSSAYYSQHFLLTPSYNLFSLVGFIISVAAFFKLADSSISGLPRIITILGMSTCTMILYAGRPPGAVIVAASLCFSLYPFIGWTKTLKNFLLYFFICLFLFALHVFFIEDGISRYVTGIRNGLRLDEILESGHTFMDFFKNLLTDFYRHFKPVSFIIRNSFFLCGSVILLCLKKIFNFDWITSLQYLLVVSMLFLSKSLERIPVGILYDHLVLLSTLFFMRQGTSRFSGMHYKKGYTFLFIVLCGAIATKIGTNNHFIESTLGSFEVYGILIIFIVSFLNDRNSAFSYIYLSAWTLVLGVIFYNRLNSPYRLASTIFDQKFEVHITSQKDTLFVSKNNLEWIKSLRALASKGGWEIGGNLIDLTGGTPGAVLLLEGHSPASPWFFGGYRGSIDYTRAALSLSDCEKLKSSWILTTEDGKRRISPDVLNSFRLNFPGNYIKLGRVYFNGHRKEFQDLWKPNVDKSSCKILSQTIYD